MKILKTTLGMLALLLTFSCAKAQNTDLASGDLSILKDQKTINVEFVYDKVAVGDYSSEADYIKHKKDEMNSKEAKSGDAWEAKWNDAKRDIYQPKFIEGLNKYGEFTFDAAAKYTLIFKVTFIEPGYQIAISKKAAQVEGTITVVLTSDKTKKLATFTVERGRGSFRGGAYDFAGRISETSFVTGREVGKLIKKANK